MINLSALNKQLDIVMPNTNRALAVVLEQATPQQLATLTKDKDLKSIMNSLLKESSVGSSADKTLLDLAKNNPTLKDLGNVTSTIKDLLNTIKLDKNPLPIETTLKNFLLDIKEMSEPLLKQKLENSGIFLESKLKDVQNPQVELKNLLQALDKSIAKSDIFTVKVVLSEKIKELLSNPTLKEASNSALTQPAQDDPKALNHIAKGVENVLSKLQEQLKSTDPMTSKTLTAVLEKLEHLTTPKLLTPENFKLPTIQETLQQLSTQLAQSKNPEAKGLLDSVMKILGSLKNIEQASAMPKAPLDAMLEKKMPEQIRSVVEPIKALIDKADVLSSKDTLQQLKGLIDKADVFFSKDTLQQLKGLVEKTDVVFSKDTLQQLSTQLAQSKNPEAKGLFDSVMKILGSLKNIEQASAMPKAPLDALLEKKMPEQIRNVIEPLKGLIDKADAVFSKETNTLAHKLAPFSQPEKLASHESVKELLSQDLKSILLKAGEEIKNSNHPNQAELLKQIDKLSLQVDYYQLVSHLSNASSLYLPFSWDALEEGNIHVKKDKDDKFYCDIDLKLKEYGELKLKMMLYEKNQINIHIYSNSAEFKEIVKENIGLLRSALIENKITPREIRLLDAAKKNPTSAYERGYKDINMGFEVKA